MKLARSRALTVLVHAAAWLPLAVLVYDFFNRRLTINPIQGAEIRTGNIAIVLLILSLACAPLQQIMRQPALARLSRPLGLYAYLYAFIHLAIFAGLDYGFDLQLLLATLAEKPYILAGSAAFLLLSALALTSFDRWKRILRKNWKRLHRLVYAANLIAVLHFAWAVKGDFTRLQGDILRPALAGLAVMVLLALRLPPARRALAARR